MDRLAELEEYNNAFRGALTDEDFLAAGYTPEEISAYRGGVTVAPQLTPQDITSMQETYGTLEAPDYTMRETATQRVQDALINKLGMDPYQAGSYARRIMGDTSPTSQMILDGLGLADLTPLGAVFGVEEGAGTAVEGYEQGDYLKMGLGGLEAGLGVLEAFPLTKAIGRGIAETAAKMDPNTLYSVFGPPVGTRSPLDVPVRAPETGSGSGAFEDAPNVKRSNQVLVRIPIEDVEHGESALPGGRLTFPGAENLIADYASRETPLPPIDIMSLGEDDFGRAFIADGSHRYEAAKLRGDKFIDAYVSKDDLPDLPSAQVVEAAPETVPAAPRSSSVIMPGDPEFNQTGPIDQMPVEAPRITPRDLEGARIIPTVADLTRAGGFYTGIDASKIDIPEVLMGGPGFPLLPSSQEAGLAWAVQGKSIGTKKAGTGADLIAVTAMNPTSHKSNITFINALNKTAEAYIRDGRIGDNVIGILDDKIREAGAGGDKALVGLAKFPGFKSPNAQEFIENASFQERSRIAAIIGSKEMQEAGLPNVSRVLQETVDPRYAGANPRDTVLFIEPDFNLPPVDLKAEGLPVHPSYRYGIRGRVFGALDQNISTFEMFPDFWGEKNIKAFGPAFNTGGRRAFDMQLPIQEVTGQQVQNLERIMTMEAAKNTNLSAIDTRILVNSLTDQWKPTTTSVKAGGASPQAFVDAIQNNKYRPALTNYTPQEVKAGARSGDLVAYQLGDDDVFFALDSKPDYSWAGVEMQPGDKALVGVVSNAPGSKGTAAPSVIAKALDEGANILDAFAVPSEKFPNGFLPQYYGEFGFEEVGRVPFDKDMYIEDHGEQAYEDLLDAWRSDGWDESMGMPPVIVMRWSGSDADRAATSAGIRGAGSPSHRADTEGFVAEAEGSAGRVSDEAVSGEPSGVGRGDTGPVGTGDGLRLSGRARTGAKGILGLTPEQLRNQGIPEDQIQQIMELRNIGR